MAGATTDLDVGAIFAAGLPLFGSVPGAGEEFVCRCCLGPRGDPPRFCYACRQLFFGPPPGGGAGLAKGRAERAPRRLAAGVVPMTAALNPSPWYTRLATYKRGNPEFAPLLGALAATFLAAHAGPIGALLGGAPTLLTTVPSKRGISYHDQPLRRALALYSPARQLLAPVLAFDLAAAPATPGVRGTAGHGRYTPGCFKPLGRSPLDERIVLVEDTWVTGATALSAAGALLEHGAAAIAILPLARCLDTSYWGELHPYRAAADRPYRAAFWPRAAGAGSETSQP